MMIEVTLVVYPSGARDVELANMPHIYGSGITTDEAIRNLIDVMENMQIVDEDEDITIEDILIVDRIYPQ